ncbi:MAG: hypothetical protein COW24_01640 [Candidatus Kerfeldbacteria bacterium CG15_BIG_FIL_POST_REV_8_21_14_020_45_12]|uniref:Uncharacterized protein n=1 Tax=Candidatus Kerfeldbacteria bacterium CG15_BIG_FIL_POST_REV_8_21_14_020_45_12 TaxID=2014247 RepID=A0A2M7H4J3_9BACT|nr:MAG: hypothetical protein COW24_01640 [Candidatus Kerfeldbacteria bacterium CG15_BIG_FIL_POST_REV_8_21_14_020_45_12]PJA92931.1 MAG: hypothetical protein CO132_05480 [Candidatus Kerfeldbacteria bacterium CG_4_9_14_3_um_filter_45_8]
MKASASQYAQAWYEKLSAVPPAEWPGVSEKMLKLIRQDGKMRLLPDIVRLVEETELASQGVTQVTVRSAHDIPDEIIAKHVKQVLPEVKVKIDRENDPSIIGGIQIETANKRWDLSLRGQLRKLAQLIHSN